MARIRLADNVVYRSFGSETVLLNLTTGQYHGLRGAGGRMLEVISETGDTDEAARRLAEEYEQPLPVVTRDLGELCQGLLERSLVVLDEPGPAA
jgi:hypothetical protein